MIKKLAAHIGEYKKQTILSPLTVTLESLCEVFIPLLMARLVDKGIQMGDRTVILETGGLLILTAALSLTLGVLAGKFAAQASAGFAANLRKALFYKVQDFSFTNIDRFSTSSLVTRLTTDVTNLQNSFQMIVRIAVRAPALLIFALFMAFSINGKMALIFLSVVPVLFAGLIFVATRVHPTFERVFKTYDRLNRVVRENLRGIRVVKSFVREEDEVAKFRGVSGEIYAEFTKAERLIALNTPMMQSAVFTCILLISWFGAKTIVAGAMTTGELMSLLTYTNQILMSLMMLSMVFVMIIISRASAERIVEVLNEFSDIAAPATPVTAVADGSVEFAGVKWRCFERVGLAVASGETIGILGGTGSGKSTLVELIPRLYDPAEGVVKVGGRDVKDYDLTALRDAVAVVLQKNTLFSGTIKENLRWGDENATEEEMRRACRLAQADGFISAMPDGYDTVLEQGGSNLSGGQRQRLCIARALMKKPKVLILDDSTSAVDTATDAAIRRAFREELPGVTKLIIAQRVTSVMDADRIVVLDDGEIESVGTHDELMEKSRIYREIYELQMKEAV
ncbi:MAG TPA: ABC transporter ATP-binding protein [Candidatus Acidoferrum sp.]|nr:ABC transporter ATP-binding protein [Candidatus Acidoferrum sp.]